MTSRWHAERIRTRDIARRHLLGYVLAYGLTALVYSYFYTTIIVGNHSFPNVWVDPYPSSKTYAEGRWFSDLVLFLQGGSGVQSVQMVTATALHLANGFMFAHLVGTRDRLGAFLIAILLSLHPAFLDYYSFSREHISFVLGDTFALAGFLALTRWRRGTVAGGSAALLCFVLALGLYPPKIALVALLLLAWCLSRFLPTDVEEGITDRPPRSTVQDIAWSAFLLLSTMGVYYATILLTIRRAAGPRTHINSARTALKEGLLAYSKVLADFTTHVDYLPTLLSWLPALGIAVGVAAVLFRARKKGLPTLGLAIVLVGLLPPALNLSFIVNEQSWRAGRILAPQAYGLAFFLAAALSVTALRVLALPITVLIIYFIAIVGMQETNTAAFKTMFDLAAMSRIVARMEAVAPRIDGGNLPIAMIGRLHFNDRPYRRFPNRLYRAHITSDTFAPYRQREFVNFFMGRDAAIGPSAEEFDRVIRGVEGRPPWPATDSVFVVDGIVVVLLEAYRPGIDVTWLRSGKP
jgi:glucosyltransferase GtrII-like protein